MNSTPVPPGATTRPRPTLEEVTRAAADLITEARAAGLTAPYAINAHDYGPAQATLYLSGTDTPDIWAALQEWARRYGSKVETHEATSPGSIHAGITFRAGGVRYEVSATIHPSEGSQ